MIGERLAKKSIYPFLFVLYPVLHLFEVNCGSVPLSALLVPILFSLSAVALLSWLLARFPATRSKAPLLTAIAVVSFFGYGVVYQLLPILLPAMGTLIMHRWMFPLWLLVSAGIAVLVSRIRSRADQESALALPLNLFGATLLLVTLCASFLKPSVRVHQAVSPSAFGSIALASSKPDIYYIIMDGYGRADMLKRYHGFDNSEFLTFLKSKGFWIANESKSNYLETYLSIPSSLNFSYLSDLKPKGVSFDRWYSEPASASLLRHASIFRVMKSLGYTTVNVSSGYSLTNNLDGAEINLGYELNLNEFNQTLLSYTVLRPFLANPFQIISGPQLLERFSLLHEASHIAGPKFVFCHILSPHPPYSFDAMGRPVSQGRNPKSWENRAGYVGQVQFDNQQLETVLSQILAVSAQPPIIIIQGDHGPSLIDSTPSRPWNTDWPPAQISTRQAILNAYLVPPKVKRQLYPSITPVNSFRAILRAQFGMNIPDEPDRTLYSNFAAPLKLVLVPSISIPSPASTSRSDMKPK